MVPIVRDSPLIWDNRLFNQQSTPSGKCWDRHMGTSGNQREC